MTLFVGVDPGVTNTGWYLSRGTIGQHGVCGHFKPNSYPDLYEATLALFEEVKKGAASLGRSYKDIALAGIERYVAYAGIRNSNVEGTTLLIGSLTMLLKVNGITSVGARAIDWKTAVCKDLFRVVDFRNPSEKMDKKFSLAAAECISGEKIKIDHIADACGLAYYASMKFRENHNVRV